MVHDGLSSRQTQPPSAGSLPRAAGMREQTTAVRLRVAVWLVSM